MEYIIVIICLAAWLIITAIIYDFNIKKLKKFAISEEEKLNKITDKYPTNKEICKYMLNKLSNNNVKIEENKDYESCLYIAVQNKIIIADVKNSYTRIQTIAHECLHSVQNKKILIFNFIFSNIYLLYFIIITMLGIFNVLIDGKLFLFLMIAFSYMYYFLRSYLEMDAMIKARYLAKEYIDEIGISTKEETNAIINSYDLLNDIGIKMTNYELMLGTIIKTIIMTLAFLL